MAIILPANTLSAGGYEVANSCRFNDGDSASMTKSVSGTSQTTAGTISFWFKRGALSTDQRVWINYVDANNYGAIKLQSDNKIEVVVVDGGSVTAKLVTNRLFRDCSAWYHCCVALNSSDGTAGNRMRLYINGTEETSFATDTNPSSGVTMEHFTDGTNKIGQMNSDQYFDGYIAEFVMIHGSQLTPSSFGEFDEDSPTIWKPKDVSGLSFGSKDYYLDFEDSANLGNDANGGTDFTESNLAATDQATDTPTNNFCTLNSLHKSTSNVLLSEGNLKAVLNQTTGWQHAAGTMAVKSGKWYWEAKALNVAATDKTSIGVLQFDTTDVDFINNTNTDRSSKGLSGHGAGTGSYSYAQGEIVMCGMDLDNNKVYWGTDGTWFGDLDPAAGSGSTTQTIDNANFCVPVVGGYADSSWELNFGVPQFSISSGNADDAGYGNFEFDVPAGFYALCTKNLAEYG